MPIVLLACQSDIRAEVALVASGLNAVLRRHLLVAGGGSQGGGPYRPERRRVRQQP